MGNGLMLSMKVIRYRSRIAEALLACAAKGAAGDKEALVIEASRGSMDVIEHIAQDGLESRLRKQVLIQSLESALQMLVDFKEELARSGLSVPSRYDIDDLVGEINAC
ncbi:hypothetical protein JE959_001774 [Aeromonas veronii]|nr:hypothetical protein [Aeromonas veronii]